MTVIWIESFDYWDNNWGLARYGGAGGDFGSLSSLRIFLDTAYARTNKLYWKSDADAASTGDINLASPGATVDGVTLNIGDRVLVKDQIDQTANGVYGFNGPTSAMTRYFEEATASQLEFMAIYVRAGTVNIGTSWYMTTYPITLGTTALIYAQHFGTPYVSGRGLRCVANSGGGGIGKVLDADYTTMVFGFATRITSTGAYGKNGFLWQVGEAGVTNHLGLKYDSSGKLQLVRGTVGGTVLATGTTTMAANTWYYIEIKFTIHDSAGSAELRVNEATEFTISGVDTRNGGAGTVNAFDLMLGFADGSYEQWFDDLYVLYPNPYSIYHNDFLNDQKVVGYIPDRAGDFAQWTPSAGSNYQNVDELPPNTTDYNSSATPGQRDTFGHADVLAIGGEVNAVAEHVLIRKLDAGSKTAAGMTREFGTNYPGPTQSVLDAYYYIDDVQDVNPATGSPWVQDEINDTQFGYLEVS